MRKDAATILSVLIATAVLGALSACSSGTRSDDRSQELVTQLEADASSGSSQRGLELRVLTVDDTGDRVGRALARYESIPGAMSPQDKQIWHDWGLRWIIVPINELDAFIASQDQTQSMQVRWMGEFPQWRPIIRTGGINTQAVRIGGSQGALRTLSGKPRLLARVWATPQVSASGVVARLHLDLGIQMTQPTARNPWETTHIPTAMDEGTLIDELSITQVLDSSQALVLVGEDPTIRWIEDTDDQSVSIQTAPATSIGPGAPTVRTLGERMLSTPGTGVVAVGSRYVAPKKVLIILVPKAGGSYRLLGPTSAGPSATTSVGANP